MDNNQVKLSTYNLYIPSTRYRTMKSNIWAEDPTEANLFVDGTPYTIDITYRGFHIRKLRKKSYHIQFQQPKSFQGIREFHLNAEYSDPSNIRNKLSFDFFRSIGVLSPDANFVQLKINGRSEGVYLQLEAVDDIFLDKRRLPAGAIFYADNNDANFSLLTPENEVKKRFDAGYKQKIGSKGDRDFLCEFIYRINTLSRGDFSKAILNYIDLNKYFYWLAGVVCTQNYDGFIQNYALYRNGETGLFEMIPWDYDATWGRDIYGEIMAPYYVPIEGYNTLTARLLDIPDFRSLYRSILEEILETKFNPKVLESKVIDLYQLIRPYVEKDPYSKSKLKTFNGELDYIMNYIKGRCDYLKEHLCDLNG